MSVDIFDKLEVITKQRDQIAKLTAELHEAKHQRANEAQVAADLRDAMHVAAERLVFALWIHAAYRVDGRGPTGCIMDALDSIAPDVTASIRSGLDGHDTYAKHFGSEDDPQCEAPVPARSTERRANDAQAKLDEAGLSEEERSELIRLDLELAYFIDSDGDGFELSHHTAKVARQTLSKLLGKVRP